jgi:hypothetical protein
VWLLMKHVEQDQKPFVVVHQKVEDKVNAGLPVAIATFTKILVLVVRPQTASHRHHSPHHILSMF